MHELHSLQIARHTPISAANLSADSSVCYLFIYLLDDFFFFVAITNAFHTNARLWAEKPSITCLILESKTFSSLSKCVFVHTRSPVTIQSVCKLSGTMTQAACLSSCVHIWDEITVIEDRVDMNQYSKKRTWFARNVPYRIWCFTLWKKTSWRTDFLTTKKNTERIQRLSNRNPILTCYYLIWTRYLNPFFRCWIFR